MADDELENGRPRDHAAARPGRSPLGPSQAITLFMSLMLVGLLVCTSMPGAENVRFKRGDTLLLTVAVSASGQFIARLPLIEGKNEGPPQPEPAVGQRADQH